MQMKSDDDGSQKDSRPGEVLTKCQLRKNNQPTKSLSEIEVSAAVQVWNGTNLEQRAFMKLMHRSTTSGGFLMKIPLPFCRRYLPVEDAVMTLETESGKLYLTRYLPRQSMLSGGWRDFAKDQKLVFGDLVVLHLIEATRFKVYIMRKGSSTVQLPTHLHSLYDIARQCVAAAKSHDLSSEESLIEADDNKLIVCNRREAHQSIENSDKKNKDEKCVNSKQLESLVGYNEIKVSILFQLWNGINLEQPVFMKFMLWSHTSTGFALRIPAPFSRRYLPVVDTLMTLETENGKSYETTYLQRKSELSGGWGRFAKGQKLVSGDFAVFHLVQATRFKVYTIRKGSSTFKLPTHLLNLYEKARKCLAVIKSLLNAYDSELLVYKRRKVEELEEDSNKQNMRRNCTTSKGCEDVNASITKSLQNHELPEFLLQDYYKLCQAQNAFLHAHPLKGLNFKFFVGAIGSIFSKTANIGIALRTCTLSTFLDKFSQWNKFLTCYEALGMNVGLLSARLHHLENLAISSDGAVSRNEYIEACRERARTELEVKKLEVILAKWRKVSVALSAKVKDLESKAGWKEYMDAYFRLDQAKAEIKEIEVLIADFVKFFEHYDHVIETLKSKANNHELEFQEEVNASW